MMHLEDVEERGRDLSVADLLRHCERLGLNPNDVFIHKTVRSAGGTGGDAEVQLKWFDDQPPPAPTEEELARERELEGIDSDPLKGWD